MVRQKGESLVDLMDGALSTLDFAVAGVHSYFGLGRDEQTDRVRSALRHPVVKILAHPFGRRIGIRPPLDIDMEAVIEVAIAEDVALETNGHRDRLDLSSEWIGRAAKRGALFAANSDAHRLDEMANISNAVASLQRARGDRRTGDKHLGGESSRRLGPDLVSQHHDRGGVP